MVATDLDRSIRLRAAHQGFDASPLRFAIDPPQPGRHATLEVTLARGGVGPQTPFAVSHTPPLPIRP